MSENTPHNEQPIADILPPDSPIVVDAQTEKPAQPSDMVVFSRTTFNYVVIAVAFFIVGLLIGAIAFNQSGGVDEAAIQRIVTNALADAGVGTQREDMAQLVDDDPYIGEEDAPIVIVEFSAYACPYCGRHFIETFEPLLENYGQYIRYVYRDFPSINPNVSFPASLAAECADDQGVFWEYHRILFDNQDQLGPSYFTQVAQDLGLDMLMFNTCVGEQQHYDEVNSDFYDGLALNITGTPSFYINGVFYSGARPYEFFERVIQRELQSKGISY